MTNNAKIIHNELKQAQTVLNKFLKNQKNIIAIEQSAMLICSALKNKGKVLACGNGGSHCDAMHFAEELTGRYRDDRAPYAAISISDVSHLSCVGNDFGFDYVFSRYVEAIGQKDDVLVAISTSGNSINVINAIKTAKNKKMKVIALTGKDGGKIRALADIEINVEHFGYADRIQEIHIKIIHILILLIEKLMAEQD